MDWAYSGVNTTVPRNAGPECAKFLNPLLRWVETVIVIAMATYLYNWGYSQIHLPKTIYIRRDPPGRRLLLVVMSVIWGMEIGYKFSSKTVIYLLNPCHVTTAIQIYLLAASPNRIVTAVFRFHLNLLNGPLLAFLFPETDTRILPLETAIYWIQHGLMFVVPYYLLRMGGAYNVEKITDISWNAVSYSINIFYHFVVLQAIAVPTEVNLNHMLCPAILDPFEGPYYRFCAVFHQSFLCPLLCKLFYLISKLILRILPPTIVNRGIICDAEVLNSNGDTKKREHIE